MEIGFSGIFPPKASDSPKELILTSRGGGKQGIVVKDAYYPNTTLHSRAGRMNSDTTI